MQRHATLVTLRDVEKQKGMGRLTIGIDLGDRRSHFCVSNHQGQVIAPRVFAYDDLSVNAAASSTKTRTA